MGFTMGTQEIFIKSWESFPFQSNEAISPFLQFEKLSSVQNCGLLNNAFFQKLGIEKTIFCQ